MSDKNKFMLSCALHFVCVQIILFQHAHITTLQQNLQLSHRAKEIESDQVVDLVNQLAQTRLEQSINDVKQFVAGVVATVNKPDHYSEVWHAGYDRGAAVQQYADQLDVKTFTSTKEQ